MTNKDYRRLAKISLKSRKKTTKATVRGISFGLILLMPLLFIAMAFYIDLNQKVNQESSIRVFDVSITNEEANTTYPESVYDEAKLDGLDNVANTIEYMQYNLSCGQIDKENEENSVCFLFATIDGITIELNKPTREIPSEQSVDRAFGMSVIDMDKTTSLFLQCDYDAAGGENPLVSGSEFSSNSKGEIMLSSSFVETYNLGDDIVGKTISLSSLLVRHENITNSIYENNTDAFDLYDRLKVDLLINYKIVGIFNSDIYNTNARMMQEGTSSWYTNYGTAFWITSESINEAYLPKLIRIASDSEYYEYEYSFYYKNTPFNLAGTAIENGYVFLPLGYIADYYSNINTAHIVSKRLIEFDSYASANKAVSIIDSLIVDSSTSNEEVIAASRYMTDTFENYRLFYNIFTYVCLVLAIFGGIIFFATLLNLYNTIHYAVQSRKHYIGMLRAIGMKSKEVLMLYFVEVLEIFKRSYLWTALFGGAICAGIYFAFNYTMNSEYAKLITIKISLNPIYILASFVILVVINMIISIIFSLIATHRVSKAPILEVLDDNK